VRNGQDIINIDGVNYDFEELEPAAQYAVRQLRDLKEQLAVAQFRIDQLAAARQFFSANLSASIKAAKDPNQLELPLDETQPKKV
jgi:hypothetical protein